MVGSPPYRTSLRVAIVCPAPPESRLGNRVTAVRWERMMRELGHDAAIVERAGDDHDVLVALHATKSADAVRRSAGKRPIVLALTGTDLYRDIDHDPRARESIALADRLVVLHDLAPRDVPEEFRAKVHVVRQSAEPPPRKPPRASDVFEVALVAHARKEKDPLRAPLAARRLPTASRVRVVHAGRALSADMAVALAREAEENPRYRWLGEIAESEALALVARASLLVLTSEMEGGANVLGEAIVSGTPPIATRIPACVAALGEGYPGLFEVHETEALSELLARAERDPAFYGELVAGAAARAPLFAPAVEREALRTVLSGPWNARVS